MTAKKKARKTVKKGLNPPYSHVLGVKVHTMSFLQAKTTVFDWFNSNKQYQISTPNPEQVILAQKDIFFKKTLNKSDLSLPDGVGIVWALQKQGLENIERITGVDFMMLLCEKAAEKNWRVFLLGGRPGAAKQAAHKLTFGKDLIKSKNRMRVGYHPGAKDIRNETEEEKEEIIRCINEFRPHLLFVGYGAPCQELWIARNLPSLKVKVAMSVGGAIDYIAGIVPRAPAWARKIGLEWLFRLAYQPWRIKRQLRLLKFVYLVLFKK